MPKITNNDDSIGIITPYRDQANEILKAINNDNIEVDTVHEFQGREKYIIIISTVDDKNNDFSDNDNLINVAISRAKSKLVLVCSGNEYNKDTNVGSLIDYIKYHNFSIENSKISSCFDMLYSQYNAVRKQ